MPTFRVLIAANSPIEIAPMDAAVLRSIHAFKMPSTFVPPNDARIGQPLFYEMVTDLHHRYRKRSHALAFFKVLVGYYKMYLSVGLDSEEPSAYDLRSVYAQEHAKSEKEYFEEVYEIVGDAGTETERMKASTIHTLMHAAGYVGSLKKVTGWLKTHFQPPPDGGPCARDPRLRTVFRGGTERWVGLKVKPQQRETAEWEGRYKPATAAICDGAAAGCDGAAAGCEPAAADSK
eukprot:3834321-Prymnesium_polylepis.1